MINRKIITYGIIGLFLLCMGLPMAQAMESIPLPEHPRPDFERANWINLNGIWQFRFDQKDQGIKEEWFNKTDSFDEKIMVPFPWGSKLSEVNDKADIGWYTRKIQIPKTWEKERIFLIIGASDWLTTAWLDGQKLGEHQGGYTPFEFELTNLLKPGTDQTLVVRVDDARRMFTLYGKQGYGNARGIWQTPYIEARSKAILNKIHFTPDIDKEKVTAHISLLEPADQDFQLEFSFKTGELQKPVSVYSINKGAQHATIEIPIPSPRLWTLDDPFLYEVTVSLRGNPSIEDRVNTYFGMRKISVVNLPGAEMPYVALNNKPVYMQLTLDQAYHPEGFYTFPSDAFMKDEILRSKAIGLNGMRIHIKAEIPRKLYWADRLGMLIMEDLPNFWSEPNEQARQESETALRAMSDRDFNHPAIFSRVVFNETWGLFTNKKYLPETQEWVTSMYKLAKGLDPTRLIEDNSACNFDHVITDINTWHAYLPGYEWTAFMDKACKETFEGSGWNFVKGYKQGKQPMFNSECGNVWGYEGSTGDVDWSWDYHLMMNAFRRHPLCAGWLYTEHHDVINEWNGYYRFDRSQKFTGMEDLVPGMMINDLHAPFYIALNEELCQDAKPGELVKVPVFASFFTDQSVGEKLTLRYEVSGWNTLGTAKEYSQGSVQIPYKPWMQEACPPLEITMPKESGLVILKVYLQDSLGTVLHRNFTTFLVSEGLAPRDETITTDSSQKVRVLRFEPKSFKDAKWSLKQWNVMDGLKVNGAGAGYFEYRLPWPDGLNADAVSETCLRMELSAKQLFGKDKENQTKTEGDYMQGKGLMDPSLNPNAYPMTDEKKFPSQVRIMVNNQTVGTFDLQDDPADHRGILSWHSQLRDKKLREAGSYGYLINASIPKAVLQKAGKEKEIIIRLEVDAALPGGLAIYGERFGRYPLDPSLILVQ